MFWLRMDDPPPYYSGHAVPIPARASEKMVDGPERPFCGLQLPEGFSPVLPRGDWCWIPDRSTEDPVPQYPPAVGGCGGAGAPWPL